MQVTDELMKEHQMILKYLELMERYIEFSKASRRENILLEKAQDFISFIQIFTDTYHHAKEEDVLFKYMQAPGVLSHCNPLPVMLSEHEQGRMYVLNMIDAVANSNIESLYEIIYGYCQLLKQHIFKEDNVLYSMAENGLSDEDKIAIESEYQQIEEKLDKQAVWNDYEEKYSALENYLNSKISITESQCDQTAV
jgi:hemerythrin-like domain-containing protein